MAVTVTFPNNNATLLWAFNPNYITITGASTLAVTVTVGSRTINVSTYNGSAKVYISRLLQLAFTDPKVTRLVSVEMDVNHQHLKTVDVMWGALELGDMLGTYAGYPRYKKDGVQHIKFYSHFPFTFDLLQPPHYTLLYQEDDGSESWTMDDDYEAGEYYALFSFDPNDCEWSNQLYIRQSMQELGELEYNTIFHKDNSTEGYYLRWIDRYGMVRYYLFDRGDKTLKTELSSFFKEDETIASYVPFGGHKRNIGVNTHPSIKVCATNVERDYLPLVETIVSSPIVDLYLGEGLWLPVTVASGSFTYSTKHPALRDFEITIELPNRITQTL